MRRGALCLRLHSGPAHTIADTLDGLADRPQLLRCRGPVVADLVCSTVTCHARNIQRPVRDLAPVIGLQAEIPDDCSMACASRAKS